MYRIIQIIKTKKNSYKKCFVPFKIYVLMIEIIGSFHHNVMFFYYSDYFDEIKSKGFVEQINDKDRPRLNPKFRINKTDRG